MIPKVYIWCVCGSFHQLYAGLESPVYWCGNDLMSVVAGDVVSYCGVARVITTADKGGGANP